MYMNSSASCVGNGKTVAMAGRSLVICERCVAPPAIWIITGQSTNSSGRFRNVDKPLEQLFPGFRACILAEIARWREYDPAINPDIVDSFRSAVVGHRDRYRAKLEQLKLAASQGTGPQTIAAQIARGVPANVVILSREGLSELIATKRIAAGTDMDLARVPLGVVVRAGTPKPDADDDDHHEEVIKTSIK
jgi:hypothetical protein